MDFDLVVVGGGVVGASFLRAVRGQSIALVSGALPTLPSATDPAFDPRVYALSPGSVSFLRSIKVWDAIDPRRLTPVHKMRIHGDDGKASLELDAYRTGVSELAWIVEDRALQAALWDALRSQERLEILAPAQCASIQIGDASRVTLSDGRTVAADLLVGADGAESFVRAACGIGVTEKAYGQTAVVANFECTGDHGNTAWQWFQGGPVLALLPLPENRISMVWALPDEEAKRVMELRAETLASEVGAAAGGAVGSLTLISPVKGFPLREVVAERMVLPHVALAGDAAHVIHPLAGQGLNLGLQDASALADILNAREPVRRAGDLTVLRRYERERSEAILAMRSTVHGLQRLFGSQARLAGRVRNMGLNFTDRLPVLKNALVRHALI